MSVVIPTRNRPDSVRRLLASLAEQERIPDEVIIVDASDEVDATGYEACASRLSLEILRTTPHLCRQRNRGIRHARGSLVLLCDDDVEPPPDYLRRLLHFLDTHPGEGAVTGHFKDRTASGTYAVGLTVPSVRRLLFAWLFQLTVWGDVEGTRRPVGPLGLLIDAARRFYGRRGNTWSLAGWPLLTQVRGDVVRAAVYTLGAALVRRDWLLGSPYDERLVPHGIGDHYGVALGFPVCPGVAILRDLEVPHHRAPQERLAEAETYFARVLALDLFVRESPRLPSSTRWFLIWSLIGSSTVFAVGRRWPLLERALRGIAIVAFNRNPLRRPAARAASAAT